MELWAEDEARLGPAGGKEAHCQGKEGLQIDLPLQLRAAPRRGGILADPARCQHRGIRDGSVGIAKEVGAGENKRVVLVVDRPGGTPAARSDLPEGIHLEFLPSGSPELQPAERLWPLTDETVVNRLFKEIEEALAERCLQLLD